MYNFQYMEIVFPNMGIISSLFIKRIGILWKKLLPYMENYIHVGCINIFIEA